MTPTDMDARVTTSHRLAREFRDLARKRALPPEVRERLENQYAYVSREMLTVEALVRTHPQKAARRMEAALRLAHAYRDQVRHVLNPAC